MSTSSTYGPLSLALELSRRCRLWVQHGKSTSGEEMYTAAMLHAASSSTALQEIGLTGPNDLQVVQMR